MPALYVEGNAAEIALVENLLRQDLTAVEEAEALDRIIREQGYRQDDLAKAIGKSASTISEILSLNRLPLEIRDDCRGNPKVARSILVNIAKCKQECAMVTKYRKYRDALLAGNDGTPSTGRTKRTAAERAVLLCGTTGEKLANLDLAACTAAEKDAIDQALNALKEVVDSRLAALTAAAEEPAVKAAARAKAPGKRQARPVCLVALETPKIDRRPHPKMFAGVANSVVMTTR